MIEAKFSELMQDSFNTCKNDVIKNATNPSLLHDKCEYYFPKFPLNVTDSKQKQDDEQTSMGSLFNLIYTQVLFSPSEFFWVRGYPC